MNSIEEYRPHIADKLLDRRLNGNGAVLPEGENLF